MDSNSVVLALGIATAAGGAVMLIAAMVSLREISKVGRDVMMSVSESLESIASRDRSLEERLVEKILTRDPDYAMQMHSTEQDDRRLDAFEAARAGFLNHPPDRPVVTSPFTQPIAPDLMHGEVPDQRACSRTTWERADLSNALRSHRTPV